jgi:hypothetical protein
VNSVPYLLVFVIGLLVGRSYAPRRARNALIVGPGLPVDHAVRRPELRDAFRADWRSRGR